jgi:hypothetical protein
MAKAIYGHTGVDARLAAEVARLRARVRDLEAEVDRLQAAADLVARSSADWDAGDWPAQDWAVPADLLVPDPR